MTSLSPASESLQSFYDVLNEELEDVSLLKKENLLQIRYDYFTRIERFQNLHMQGSEVLADLLRKRNVTLADATDPEIVGLKEKLNVITSNIQEFNRLVGDDNDKAFLQKMQAFALKYNAFNFLKIFAVRPDPVAEYEEMMKKYEADKKELEELAKIETEAGRLLTVNSHIPEAWFSFKPVDFRRTKYLYNNIKKDFPKGIPYRVQSIILEIFQADNMQTLGAIHDRLVERAHGVFYSESFSLQYIGQGGPIDWSLLRNILCIQERRLRKNDNIEGSIPYNGAIDALIVPPPEAPPAPFPRSSM